MENTINKIEKYLKVLFPIIGMIGVGAVIFFWNNPDSFSAETFGLMKFGGKISAWSIFFYLIFGLWGFFLENFSNFSRGIIIASLALIAGFSMELFGLSELKESLFLTDFSFSYLIIYIINFISISTLVILSIISSWKNWRQFNANYFFETEIMKLKIMENFYSILCVVSGILSVTIMFSVLFLILLANNPEEYFNWTIVIGGLFFSFLSLVFFFLKERKSNKARLMRTSEELF